MDIKINIAAAHASLEGFARSGRNDEWSHLVDENAEATYVTRPTAFCRSKYEADTQRETSSTKIIPPMSTSRASRNLDPGFVGSSSFAI